MTRITNDIGDRGSSRPIAVTEAGQGQAAALRSYADFVDDIAPDALLLGLLDYGLFDEKLPPLFTSAGLCAYYLANGKGFSGQPKGFMSYQCVRNTGATRLMGVPHPIAYARLSGCLGRHWGKVAEVLKNNSAGQAHKVSRIHLRRNDSGPLFRMGYSAWRLDGDPVPQLQVGARYRVDADVAQCFPSIYTHAVSWALVGKAEAKANRHDRKKWYNQIDLALRNCKDGETHGVHIGPHASNLVAEVVLSAVDAELVSSGHAFVRHVDDYECYARSFERAQAFLRDLDDALLGFGLMRNQRKSAISPLAMPTQDEWPRALKAFPLPAEGAVGRGSALAFLDRAVDLMRGNQDDASAISYALKVLASKKLTPQAREVVAARGLHFARLYPYLLPFLEETVIVPCGVKAEALVPLARDLCAFAKETRLWYPAYYAVYYALRYGFALAGFTVDDALESGDCVLKACELAYAKARRNSSAVGKLREDARSIAEADELDSNWLFVYEALPHRELGGDLAALKRSGFSFLKDVEIA